MAFPVVVQHDTTTAKANTVNVNYPTGMTSGNLVVFFLGWVDDASPVSYTGSALLSRGGQNANSNNQSNILVWYREVDGTEGTSEPFSFNADKETTAHVVEVSGWDTSEPPLAAYATTGTSGTVNPDPPSRAWTWSGDTLALAGFVIRGNEVITTQPTGYTQVVYGNSAGNAGHVISEKNVTSSPEDPSSYTIENSKEAVTFTLVIKAAAAASGGTVGVWTGSAFVQKPVKVWTGSAFETKPLKRWNGSAFV
jgi:hypothetical protein